MLLFDHRLNVCSCFHKFPDQNRILRFGFVYLNEQACFVGIHGAYEIEGTNRLVGRDTGRVIEALRELETKKVRPSRPPLWDGHASQRIAEALTRRFGDGA